MQGTDRTIDMLEDITENQLKIMNQLDQGFEKLGTNVDKAIGAIGSAVQLMINLQQSDIPILFFVLTSIFDLSTGTTIS